MPNSPAEPGDLAAALTDCKKWRNEPDHIGLLQRFSVCGCANLRREPSKKLPYHFGPDFAGMRQGQGSEGER